MLPMSFIQRELNHIAKTLRHNPQCKDYEMLYVAQQALSWALDPCSFASPMKHIKGIQEGSAGCLEGPHQPPS